MKRRSFLFIHQNMPGQFLHLCMYLRDRGHDVVFITKNKQNHLSGVRKILYETRRQVRPEAHPYLKSVEEGVLHGQSVFRIAQRLKEQGFTPDIIVGHCGWGETLFIKDVFPDRPLLNYFEFFYNAIGQDVGFDPEYGTNIDSILSLRVKNTINLLASAGCDKGMTPTQWQYLTYPADMRGKIAVIHEGVDTETIRPQPEAVFTTRSGKVLRAGQKVVTFIARNLEPYRGFHVFMRALPDIQKRHPDADILIVGSDGVSYGSKLPEGDSYKKRLLAEVTFNPETVHFTGYLKPPEFRAAMHVSAAHIYLTYPFVLSWSLLEAMASGCVVVGSRTPPVEEVITDRRNGLLVDFFDRAALVDRVDEALSDPGAMNDIREAARNTAVSRYDLRSVCMPRQLGLLNDMIAQS